jgi:hypothetical protein
MGRGAASPPGTPAATRCAGTPAMARSVLLCTVLAGCTPPEAALDGTAGREARSPASFEIADSTFGVVAVRNDTVCLRTVRRGRPPDTVPVIVPGRGVSTRARVLEALAHCPDAVPGLGMTHHRLSADGFEAGDLGIAVLVEGASVLAGPATELDRDGLPESYRACTSLEGVHLTVWAGEPLRGERLWHHYHYLGYDVEPTCVDADFEDT